MALDNSDFKVTDFREAVFIGAKPSNCEDFFPELEKLFKMHRFSLTL